MDRDISLHVRRLPLSGCYNFRDLGGYPTSDGRRVKWKLIFRSDDLNSLTPSDVTYLSSIPIRTVVDFRSQMEIDMAADKMSSLAAKYYQLSIDPGNLSDLRNFVNLKSADVEGKMQQMSEDFVTQDVAIAQWKAFFGLLQDGENEPLVSHCSAGKDRTGMAAALTLFALGVDQSVIMDDYLLSNDCLTGKYQSYIDRYPELNSLFVVKREYLQAGIDKIEQLYGTPENFLTEKLGVDIPKFRDIYLERSNG